MSSTQQLDSPDESVLDAAQIGAVLSDARTGFRESPAGTLAVAIRCNQRAGALGEPTLVARALALEGHVALHRGDIRSGLALALEGERVLGARDDCPTAQAEVAALRAQVSFFTGAYSHALASAERAIEYADASNDIDMRIFARRAAFIVFGNVTVRELDKRLDELLDLTVEAGATWEQAITYNDIACYREATGDGDARVAIERAFALASMIRPNRFALAVIHSTRADIELTAGNPAAALVDAERSLELLAEGNPPNPYVLGASVRAQVVARMALGEYDGAQAAGESALNWLGERMPHTRSTILAAVAEALREAGRLEEAYEALSRSAALERQAFTEISELQLSLERAVLQARLARNETDALAIKNRELAEAHTQLESRTQQLEELQEQLRDQAERDYLTGLHNRRYLARELAAPSADNVGPLSVAVVDLDHFKQINDRHGHSIGDQVLVRAAQLLTKVLRASDIVVRSGGEEFLVLMPRTDANAAAAGCDRIRLAIREEPWEEIAPGLTLTTSVGLATAENAGDLEALVKLADKRLYDAKSSGRDCVVAA
ncbi:MAG TPA: GGDEF domain-containing protein [Solirubrobacteraceae bacterium]|nr:GGDEF domain-containing protein [Solirubrobacteraceae bacterium]